MSELNEIKTVGIRKLRPNMILAEDVVNKHGVIIIAKNTMINETNYTMLKSNDILNVRIWANSIDNSRDIIKKEVNTLEEQMKPIVERVEFKSFESEYETEIEKTKENFLAIGEGSTINVDELYDSATSVMNKINCKSDLLNYINCLRVTDDHTYSHSLNVSLLCNLFASWANFSSEDKKLLTVSGILHDLGKLKIDKAVLNKQGKLTDGEYEQIKEHTILGYEMIENMDLPDEVKMAVLMHHEKADGSGYPLGVKSNKIGRFAKIVTICDIYDAMTSKRCYRGKLCPFSVIEDFEHSNFGILDTKYLLIFLQNISYSYMGSWAQLSDGRIAKIVFINRQCMSKPIVKVKDSEEFVDLLTSNLKIDKIL